MEKAIRNWLPLCVIATAAVVAITTSTDFSQDLGRHLKLGELILSTGVIPAVNLFSYTNTDFPFANHHWLAEVLFYLSTSVFGVMSLAILKVVTSTASIALALKSAKAKAGLTVSCFVALLYLPLLLERLDIRPELFGYVYFSSIAHLLFFQKNEKLRYAVVPIMALWINTHISFVFGIFLFAVYILSNLRFLKGNAMLLASTLLAMIFNPHGIGGITYPFRIFGNYGYTIVENQNIFFLNSFSLNPFIRYFFILSPIAFISILILVARRNYALSFILLVFFLLPVWQIRHLPFFVLAAIPCIAVALQEVVGEIIIHLKGSMLKQVGIASVCLLFIGLVLASFSSLPYLVFDRQKTFGLGFEEPQKEAAQFVLRHRLQGNIFNNFDIGGYAIYRLYPTYKVYIDNRPEAYPSTFIQEEYIKLQEDESLRKRVFAKRKIHTVFFSHTDMTPWGSAFIQSILKDPNWKMVYLNESVIILSDKTDLPDIRNDRAYLQKLIDKQTSHIALLGLSSLYFTLSQPELAGQVLTEARKTNPLSCALIRDQVSRTANTPYFYQAQALRSKSWWCY